MHIPTLTQMLVTPDNGQASNGTTASSPALARRASAQEAGEAAALDQTPPDSVVLKIESDSPSAATGPQAFINPVYANPQSKSASNGKPPDFVAFAVSAMRDYADEAERAKKAAGPAPAAAPPNAPMGKFLGLEKLAARLHLFA